MKIKYTIHQMLACLFLTAVSLPSLAQVTIYAYDISGLYQLDGGGAYDSIVKELVLDKDLGELKVLPGFRAEQEFANCRNCCITPANTNPAFYDFGSDVFATDPMNVAEIYIFSQRGSDPIVTVDQIAGKRVGIRRSMATSLKSVLDRGDFKLQPVDTIEQNVAKLDRGRIHAFIDFVPDVYLAADEMGIEPHPHAKGEPLERHPDSLACRNVSPSFIKAFNDGLRAMKDEGGLQLILGESLVEP